MASPLCLYYLKRGDVVICDYAATVLLLYEAPPSGQYNKEFCKLDLWRPELLSYSQSIDCLWLEVMPLLITAFLCAPAPFQRFHQTRCTDLDHTTLCVQYVI